MKIFTFPKNMEGSIRSIRDVDCISIEYDDNRVHSLCQLKLNDITIVFPYSILNEIYSKCGDLIMERLDED